MFAPHQATDDAFQSIKVCTQEGKCSFESSNLDIVMQNVSLHPAAGNQ